MQKLVVREINTRAWRSTEDYENIINMTNVGLTELSNNENNISIYPNPTSETLNIQISNANHGNAFIYNKKITLVHSVVDYGFRNQLYNYKIESC